MLYFRAEYQINSVERQRANTTCVTTITNNRDGGIGSSDQPQYLGYYVYVLVWLATKE